MSHVVALREQDGRALQNRRSAPLHPKPETRRCVTLRENPGLVRIEEGWLQEERAAALAA